LRQYASEHLAAKLAKHSRQIQSVVIRLVDVNGTKGGEDKTCEVEVYVRARPPVVVSATDQDMHAAIDTVADRVQNALSRQLERGRELPRQRGGKVVRARKALH
jgi:ribosomal subunit interface protein